MRFNALDSIRGIAALSIVLFHLKFSFPGYLAVDLFFILSGFILNHKYFYPSKVQKISLADFTIARLSRLYPLHIFTLFIILFVYIFTDSFPKNDDGYIYTFIQHTLLLQNTGLSSWWLTWNEPSWSVSVEFWVNLIVFSYIAYRANTLTLLLISILCYVILIHNFKHLDVHIQVVFDFLNGGLIRCFAGFTLGMVIYNLFDKLQKINFDFKNYFIKYSIFSLLEVALLSASLYLIFLTPIRTKFDFNAPFIFSALILIFAFENGIISQFFYKLKFAFLGTLSYSIYLNHFWLLALMKQFDLPTYGIKIETLVWVFPLLILISILTYYLIEKPAKQWSRKVYFKLKQ